MGECIVMKKQLIMAAIVGFVLNSPALAQDNYPSRTVRIIVPYTPGGITDILARIAAEGLSKAMGQPFIVENRAGGGTSIGTRAVVTAPADGYTLLMGTTVLSINPHLMANLDYDARKDLVPVINMGETIGVIAVPPNSPAKTLGELVAIDKARPGQLSFGTAGPGSVGHIAGEAFNQSQATKFVHVPYRGSSPLLNDALGGHIPVIIDGLITMLPSIQAEKLRPLAILQSKRTELLPDVPTSAEAGYPELLTLTYFGILAPRGTPAAVVTKLNAEINRILQQTDVQQKIKQQGGVLVGGSPDEFATLIDKTTKLYGDVIKKANITAD